MAGSSPACGPTISPPTSSSAWSPSTESVPADVADVFMGCANQAGEDNRDVARIAVLLAGFPETVPGVTVNRLCERA